MANNKLPRGLRNNNPGNIRYTNIAWKGKIYPPNKKDNEFEEFESIQYGVRAMTKNFNTYIKRDPDITLYEMIAKWAPPTENDTQSYIKSVVKRTGVPSSTKGVDFYYDNGKRFLFLLSVIIHENGMAIDHQEIAEGIEMANIPYN
jgi:hypothetical protein